VAVAFKKIIRPVMGWILVGLFFVVYGIVCMCVPHNAKYPEIRKKKAA